MSRLVSNKRARVRAKIFGTTTRPRLSLHISNKHIRVQLIDDSISKTLVAITTENQKQLNKASLTTKAEWAATALAQKAKSYKIKKVVFDRGKGIYHGRVKAFAEVARKEGLEF